MPHAIQPTDAKTAPRVAQTPLFLNPPRPDQAAPFEAAEFDEFVLRPAARSLLRRGAPVEIGSRTLDVLIALLERAGEVVTRKEIEARAYPGVSVGEGALRLQIAYLRKALGDNGAEARYITTVSGRGYCFSGPVARGSHRAGEITVPQAAGEAPGAESTKERDDEACPGFGPDLADFVGAVASALSRQSPIRINFSLLGARGTLFLESLPG